MYKKIERLLFLVVLIVTLTILSIQYVKEDVRKSNEEEAIEKFFKTSITGQTVDKREHVNTKLDYIAVLEIPEISLKKGLVSIESKYNDINYNIETLEGSVYPDKVGDLYLAAHSGTSGISFFKNLYKLNVSDEVILYYNGTIYKYVVDEVYEQDKTGEIVIKSDKTNRIILTTCSMNENRQLIVIAILVDEVS